MKKNAKNATVKKFYIRRKSLISIIVAALILTIVGGRNWFGHSTAQKNDSPVAIAAPAAQFCNPTPISITGILGNGKATPYPSNINVSGVDDLVTTVRVTLNTIQHTWSRDIDILLVGPNGEKFIIMSDVGQSQGFDAPATITISDAGASLLPSSGPIPSGTYKPANYSDDFNPDTFASPAPIAPYSQPGPAPAGSATFSSVFNQANPNGVWMFVYYGRRDLE